MHESYDYGLWLLVLINVMIFTIFTFAFIKPSKKYEWRSLGVFAAFIVALFTEMYGFPLTIYFLVSFFGDKIGIVDPFVHLNGHLLGTLFGASAFLKYSICLLGGIIMWLGALTIYNGWRLIHGAKGNLVTTGIYSKIRHPQYSGIFLLSIGMLIQWPTLLTILMFPILIFAYYRLAKREEKDIEAEFSVEYKLYKEGVPAFIPKLKNHFKMTEGVKL
ncbi:hypothetical protein MNBD_IGNAVI01-2669 [hydrothermal vent metagenome]|uniref:Isoprenylcysteine carboxyl methyltransferase n=1 Tax=hydrothermal vent metagenome TaxID=652676 RepID=A0A3B1CDJ3_9ZZZZ